MSKKIEFSYKALNDAGKVVEGVKTAENDIDLQKDLKKENLNLLSAKPVQKNSFANLKQNLLNFGKISDHEKIILNRNLGSMLEAGLPLSRALGVIEKQTGNEKLRNIINEINSDVQHGNSLSFGMSKFPKVFSPLVVSMIQSGEESGNLSQALNVVADQMEKTYHLKKKVRGAMIYPAVIVSAIIVIGILMLIYVVPTLDTTFKELEIDLPATTRFIINLSNFIKQNLIMLCVFVAAIILGIKALLKFPKVQKKRDLFLLKIPLISNLLKEINTARTTRTLASLLTAGVPFIKALEITEEVVQNVYYKEVIKEAEKNLQLGLPISKVFREAEHLYPIFVSEMMAVGEEAGNLGSMLLKVANFYENEVSQKTQNISTIIEPFLMIGVGIVVAFFALAMLTPMYSLVDTI